MWGLVRSELVLCRGCCAFMLEEEEVEKSKSKIDVCVRENVVADNDGLGLARSWMGWRNHDRVGCWLVKGTLIMLGVIIASTPTTAHGEHKRDAFMSRCILNLS